MWRPNNGNRAIGPRNFYVPKRASELKYWYKTARKSLVGAASNGSAMPEWADSFAQDATVEVDSIIVDTPKGSLYIARKKRI